MANNTTFTAPQLPLEIWTETIPYLEANLPDLLSASLVSRHFRAEIQRILFRHPSQILFQHNKDKFPAFINAIASSPDRLGRLVRTYTHNQLINPFPGYIIKLGGALRAMTNLKRLAFSGSNIPYEVLHGCTFQLDAFHWEDRSSAMQILMDFLPAQASLKHLTFRCNRDVASDVNIALAESVCPSLESLAGAQGTIDLFIKGKKVTYLQLDPEGWSYYIPSKLLEISQSLVLLETSIEALEGEDSVTLLSKLTTLRVLILRLTMSSSNAIALERVRKILACCPHLSHIDLEILSTVYQRFTQASLDSTPMQGTLIGIDHPPSSLYSTYTSISAFDGIKHFSDSILANSDINDINFERDFDQWF